MCLPFLTAQERRVELRFARREGEEADSLPLAGAGAGLQHVRIPSACVALSTAPTLRLPLSRLLLM